MWQSTAAIPSFGGHCLLISPAGLHGMLARQTEQAPIWPFSIHITWGSKVGFAQGHPTYSKQTQGTLWYPWQLLWWKSSFTCVSWGKEKHGDFQKWYRLSSESRRWPKKEQAGRLSSTLKQWEWMSHFLQPWSYQFISKFPHDTLSLCFWQHPLNYNSTPNWAFKTENDCQRPRLHLSVITGRPSVL